jgi:predicted tellurium resistance membrane protein TerC
MTVLERYPVLVWAGAALLGWVAGELIAGDPLVHGYIAERSAVIGWQPDVLEKMAGTAGAIIVVALGYWLRRRHPVTNEDVATSG